MRKLLLILCIAFVVVCYGYPCLVLPFGTYSCKAEVAGTEITSTIKFGFDKKAEYTVGDVTLDLNYKLSGNTVILSEDEEFDESDMEITIGSIYRIGEYHNMIGLITTIGIGILALCLVVTIPKG